MHTGGQLDEPLRAVFREAFANADLPHFSPHSFRKTLARLGQQLCRSPEEYKAWSQNLGHEGVVRVLKSMAEKLIGGCRPRWRVLSKTWEVQSISLATSGLEFDLGCRTTAVGKGGRSPTVKLPVFFVRRMTCRLWFNVWLFPPSGRRATRVNKLGRDKRCG